MTKLEFKSESFVCIAELQDNATSNYLITRFPLEVKALSRDNAIYFNVDLDAPLAHITTKVQPGDVAYSPDDKAIYIFSRAPTQKPSAMPIFTEPVVIIGKTLSSPDEVRDLLSGKKISISVREKDSKPTIDDKRILTQKEIDALVKEMRQKRG